MLRYNDNFHTQYWAGEYGLPYDSVAQYKLLKAIRLIIMSRQVSVIHQHWWWPPSVMIGWHLRILISLLQLCKISRCVLTQLSYMQLSSLVTGQILIKSKKWLQSVYKFCTQWNEYQTCARPNSSPWCWFYKTDKWREEEAKEHAKQIKKLQQRIDKLNETKDK